MPYQAEQDVTIPRCIGHREIPGTTERVELKESVNYPTGAVIFEKDMTPDVLARLEQGDDHLSTLLRYIDVAEAQQILGRQAQAVASQPSEETEILHSEERLGGGADSSSPTVSPEVEVAQEPPYEAPPVSKEVSDSGTSDTTDPPSAETQEEVETATEEETEGSTESAGESTEEVIEETDAEAAEESTTEDQENGQDHSTDTQEETVTDKYDEMDLDELKADAKARKLSGRSKLKTEDALRAALREDDSE